MRLLLPVLAIFLLAIFSFPAYAASPIEIQVDPIDNVIDWNSTATFNLVVRNFQSNGDFFRLRPATFEWGQIVFDEPVVMVPANGFEQVSARLAPPRDVRINSYAVEILALAESNPEIRGSNFLKVVVTSELPKIEPDWNSLPKSVDPGSTPVNFIIKNTGSIEVSNIVAKLESPLLAQPMQFDLGTMAKGEARVVWDGSLDIPSNTASGVYDFTLTAYQSGKFVNSYAQPVEVSPKASVKIDLTEEAGFLSKTYTAAITNVGNTYTSDYFSASTPSWQRLFVYSKNNFDMVTGAVAGTVDAKWPYSLNIGEQATVVYKISFIPILALLLALLVIGYSLAWYLKQDLSIPKEITNENKALKIKITVKNGSQRPRHNVIVEDFLHTPLKLTREFAHNAVPKAIKKSGGAVRIVWRFDTVWPGEEKTITYGISSALPLVGGFLLPSAKIRTKTADNGVRVYLSNQVSVPSRIQVIEDEPKPS